MSETRRKLTTILSADVKDYTRLMQADEERTLATLKQYRNAMARLIESHGGRVINTWGDGLIAEFVSVVEAVRAAVDVQNELAGYNGARVAGERMQYRIGINLGDVIAEGDDIYGDGVNIAARLQATAKAGGIVISSTVYDQVRNKVAVGFEFLGALAVKNIDGGVPSYAVRIGAAEGEEALAEPSSLFGQSAGQTSVPDAAEATTVGSAPGDHRWLAVLAVIAAGFIAINILSWDGEFWARWPLLGIGLLAGMLWVKTIKGIDRGIARLGLVGIAIAAINLFSWSGIFWAVWPLLGLGILAGLKWAMRRPNRAGR